MSADRLLGYPLAILGGFALLAPRPGVEAGVGAVAGSGGTTSVTSPVADVNTTARAVTPQPMSGDPSAALARPPIAAPLGLMGRPSAESAELRALRTDEGRLFPELGPPSVDVQSRPVEGFSCEQPTYDMAQSVDFDIPATKDWLRGLNRPAIAVPRDQRIAKYIRYFAATPEGRQTLAAWLSRSGKYRQIVASTLEKKGLPIDLMAVMFVESGCWPTAVSSAGAVGLWQFMPKTARAYGLVVNSAYDERRSIWRSTEAAATHLADLNAQFNSWHLALAAYNYGYQQMVNRIEETRTEDFFLLANRSESLPRETALYVPKVLAVAVILRNLEYFGFDAIEQKPPISAAAIEVPPGTRLSLIARASGTSLRNLKELNPELLSEILPDPGGPLFIHLPTRGLARAKTMLPKLLDDADRTRLDLNVTSDFDWGRDEFDTNWHSRLQRTTPQAPLEAPTQENEGSTEAPRTSHRTNRVRELGELESSSAFNEDLASTPEPMASAAPRDAAPAPVVEVQPKAQARAMDMTHLVGPLSISGDPWARLEEETGTGTRHSRRGRRSSRDSEEDVVRPTSSNGRGDRSSRPERLAPPSAIERVGRGDGSDVLGQMQRSGARKTAKNEGLRVFERETSGLRDRGEVGASRSELAYTARSRAPRGGSKPVEFFYEVKPGDTLSELAVTFNVPQRNLVSANRLRDPSHILAGSRIRVLGADRRLAER